ncbi:MAG: nucleotidyltransferase domain-containing protein [Muribaculaceae bacterium]|nr:nucleotidyltransferase domain-containing protein [Roseburia sp.]MCM1429865.1 nucleotidyltransferase domain-containing protein [Muribaculaceae bacterium]MCM1492916.1 nucleotidyltransferase domain-containing protein [Muribaculaceae bacterium]
MANMPLSDILEEIKRICQEFQVEHLYLFGSYATGEATRTSDIDIVIKGGQRIPELMEQIDRIKTLKKIDVFQYDKCRNPGLREDIDRYAKKIY